MRKSALKKVEGVKEVAKVEGGEDVKEIADVEKVKKVNVDQPKQ